MVVSRANTIDVRIARVEPAKSAAMPTRAAIGKTTCADGMNCWNRYPSRHPAALPIVSNGASVPPEVPLPSEILHDMNFQRQREINNDIDSSPDNASVIL